VLIVLPYQRELPSTRSPTGYQLASSPHLPFATKITDEPRRGRRCAG